MSLKRKVRGGILAVLGYMLSPLSWWNDAFVNLPLALAFAWLVSAFFPRGGREACFQLCLIVGYWLTNIIGPVLLHKDATQMLSNQPQLYSRKELLRGLAVSLGYTAFMVVLIKLGVLKPIAGYFPYA